MRKYVVLCSDFVRGIALFCIILSFFVRAIEKTIPQGDNKMLAVVRVQRMSKISFNIRVSENVHVKGAFSSYTSKSY